VAEDRTALAPFVTHRFPLAETPEALALQSRSDDGVIKAVVHPTGSEWA
jgi:threonine dehydrogenase-like Zn-dependent dehydrogenase